MRRPPQRTARFGVARALSKLGHCSRAQARLLVEQGRVRLNGALCRNPESPVDLGHDRLEVDGEAVRASGRVYLMLNKPRGLVCTRADEEGRATVYSCFEGHDLPWISPVGRLDRASEGLLLFTNDTPWANRVLSPASHLDKTYHVQIDQIAGPPLCARLTAGLAVEGGDFLTAKRVTLLRQGDRHSWIEIVLDEGKNRHIRRLLAACGLEVLRLLRVRIGPLPLGTLAKGQFRLLSAGEVNALAGAVVTR